MTLFSQRKGIRPLQKAIQREVVDAELRNKLWSALKIEIWDHWQPTRLYGIPYPESQEVENIVKIIWLHYFSEPIDTIPKFSTGYPKSAYQVIRDYFFNAQWWEVYDFIEFMLKTCPKDWAKQLAEIMNSFLESENAAYRVVGLEIVEITNEMEIEEIESALDKSVKASRTHFSRALELLSDRKKPDYRNSIKEAISAVEATCQALTGKKATLADCLKLIKAKRPLHPAFEQALSKLYGFTSDDGGIRHALTEDSQEPSYADAKFMLVACAAFTNYVWAIAAETGIASPRP